MIIVLLLIIVVLLIGAKRVGGCVASVLGMAVCGCVGILIVNLAKSSPLWIWVGVAVILLGLFAYISQSKFSIFANGSSQSKFNMYMDSNAAVRKHNTIILGEMASRIGALNVEQQEEVRRIARHGQTRELIRYIQQCERDNLNPNAPSH